MTFVLSIIYPFKVRKDLKINIDIISEPTTGAWVGIILSIILKPLYIDIISIYLVSKMVKFLKRMFFTF